MFAALFASVFEFLLFVGAAVLVYQIFLSDWLAAKRSQWKESKEKYSSISKIALVKLVSDNAEDIEKFVTQNAQFLSEEMVGKLVSRIEEIKAGGVIAADEILKTRISDLKPSPELEEEQEEAEEEKLTINGRGV